MIYGLKELADKLQYVTFLSLTLSYIIKNAMAAKSYFKGDNSAMYCSVLIQRVSFFLSFYLSIFLFIFFRTMVFSNIAMKLVLKPMLNKDYYYNITVNCDIPPLPETAKSEIEFKKVCKFIL